MRDLKVTIGFVESIKKWCVVIHTNRIDTTDKMEELLHTLKSFNLANRITIYKDIQDSRNTIEKEINVIYNFTIHSESTVYINTENQIQTNTTNTLKIHTIHNGKYILTETLNLKNHKPIIIPLTFSDSETEIEYIFAKQAHLRNKIPEATSNFYLDFHNAVTPVIKQKIIKEFDITILV